MPSNRLEDRIRDSALKLSPLAMTTSMRLWRSFALRCANTSREYGGWQWRNSKEGA